MEFFTPSFGDECVDMSFLDNIHLNQKIEQEQISVNENREERRRMRTLDESAQLSADDVNFDLCDDLLGTGATPSTAPVLASQAQAPLSLTPPTPPQTLASRKQLTATLTGGDPNEPSKPLSAYSLFFRDTVSTIKQQNPNSSYNELLRIVANLWELLDEERKSVYKNRTEAARLEYIKQMNAYRQQQQQQQQPQQQQPQTQQSLAYQLSDEQPHLATDTNAPNSSAVLTPKSNTAQLQTKPAVFTIRGADTTAPSTSTGTSTDALQPSSTNTMTLNTDAQPMVTATQTFYYSNDSNENTSSSGQYQMPDNVAQQLPQPLQQTVAELNANEATAEKPAVTTTAPDANTQQLSATAQTTQDEPAATEICIRDGCNKRAIVNLNWDDEYCSNECVVAHCRNVFTTWVEEYRLEIKQQPEQQPQSQSQPQPQQQQQPEQPQEAQPPQQQPQQQQQEVEAV